MRISEKGQIMIPRRLREQCGFNHDVERREHGLEVCLVGGFADLESDSEVVM